MNGKESSDHITRYLSGTFSDEDARKVLEDIREGKNIDFYDKHLKNRWLITSESQNSQGEEDQYYEESTELIKKLTQKRSILQRLKPLITIAASILLLVGIGFTTYKYLNIENNVAISYATDSTGIGQTKEIQLSDGTIVILNACSRIEYPVQFSKDSREVKLIGQAFFKVTRNENQPFIVNTDKFNVKVLGTQFDIKAYAEDEILSVNVESGKVQVDLPESMTRLVANEKLIINTRTNSHYKETVDHEVAIWRSGKLLFNKTPVREVAKELERVYNCTITFKEGQSFDNLISGEHTNQSLESVLESIEFISGIHAIRDASNNQILLYKN